MPRAALAPCRALLSQYGLGVTLLPNTATQCRPHLGQLHGWYKYLLAAF